MATDYVAIFLGIVKLIEHLKSQYLTTGRDSIKEMINNPESDIDDKILEFLDNIFGYKSE